MGVGVGLRVEPDHLVEGRATCEARRMVHLEQPWPAAPVEHDVEAEDLEAREARVVVAQLGQGQD